MKYKFLIILFLLVGLSAQAQSKLPVIDKSAEVQGGFRATARSIDIIVIHSSYCPNVDSFSVKCVMDLYKQYGVSSHYLIGRGGEIYQLVKEKDVAYHAGVSRLPGTDRCNLNTNSIGIEIVNTHHTPPTQEQYDALEKLVKDIEQRYPIKYLVRHSDIAPDRKTDPWLFDWEMFIAKLAE